MKTRPSQYARARLFLPFAGSRHGAADIHEHRLRVGDDVSCANAALIGAAAISSLP